MKTFKSFENQKIKTLQAIKGGGIIRQIKTKQKKGSTQKI